MFVIGGFALAAYTLYSPGNVRFTPTEGEVRDYLVATQVEITPDEDSRQQRTYETTSRGVMRYHVDDAGDTIRLRVVPELLAITRDNDTLFASNDTGSRATQPIADLLRDGFKLTLDADGKSRIELVNKDKLDALGADMPDLTGDAFQTQVIDPMIAQSLPAKEGAEVSLDTYRGMQNVSVKVVRVDDDSLSLQITGSADTLDEGNPIVGQLSGLGLDARISDVRLQARVRVDRSSGWMESMAAVSDMRIQVRDRTANVRSLSYALHRDDLATGGYGDGLSGLFDNLPLAEDREYPIPQSPADTHPEPQTPPTDLELASRNPAFIAQDRRLTLALDMDSFDDIPFSSLELTDITLYDDQDQRLDIPLVFDTIDYDYESTTNSDGPALLFKLVSLGWDDPDLDRVARVEAQFAYTRPDAGEPQQLELGDEPSQLGAGDIRVTARPVPDEDNSWWVDLYTDSSAYYWLDGSTAQPDLQATTLAKAQGSWLTTPEEVALARVDQPMAWRQHLKVQADHTPAELALRHTRTDADKKVYTVSFKDYAARYSNRDLAPPQKKKITAAARTQMPAEGPIALDDIQTTDADKNRLRMVLPEGLVGACELSADAPAQAGHELVWQRRPAPKRYYGRQEDADTPGEQTWELATDDGIRTYFYGIEVETTLACTGTPRWQRTSIDSDKPWLIDLKAVTGRMPDPDQSAAAFFDSVRIVDADGNALRPMRKDAAPDQRLADWPEEAAEHSLGDYMYEDGIIRLWGSADQVLALKLGGEPNERRWNDKLEALP